ncbi:MAG: membrane protein insertase YidC [Candidatus Omnitrophica bacterium]|nr:membrane protein insertase YidC [Candidatus Omnitrophota bacterium]
MEKKLLIALGLSLLVLVAFQKLAPRQETPAPVQVAAPVAQVAGQKVAIGGSASEGAAPLRAETFLPEEPLKETLTEVQTETFSVTFSDIGGSIKKLILNEYRIDDEEEVLLDEGTPSDRLFALNTNAIASLEQTKFALTQEENILEYKYKDSEWMEVTKRYTLHKSLDYMNLELSFTNLSSRDIAFSYNVRGPSCLKASGKMIGRNFTEMDALIDGKLWKKKSAKSPEERSGYIEWAAMKNRYFAIILKPFTLPRAVIVSKNLQNQLVSSLGSETSTLSPGETLKEEYVLYAGPLSEKRLEAMGYKMSSIIDYGFFGGVSKVILAVLRMFFNLTHNWGVSILLVSFFINLILLPLTYKSFSSMQQMKKVQPHLAKLKEIHKDNPQKLNKETMELYKKYNVNPLGGCLPMLLQMPIFIALYQGLVRSVELKGASFLWIKDLSRPDAVPLPFTLPVIGDHINILPLLMAGLMVVQQKISQAAMGAGATPEQASQQKMMMMVMPIMFGFLFYKMPAGLVLYWLTNTILMTAEQGFIGKRLEAR